VFCGLSESSHAFGTLIALRGRDSHKFDLGPTCWRSRDEPAAVENAMNPLAASFGETLASPDRVLTAATLALVLIGVGLARLALNVVQPAEVSPYSQADAAGQHSDRLAGDKLLLGGI
jgi:hypothetical protein